VIKQALMPAIALLASVGLVATNLNGVGATFPAILYAQMFADYAKRTGVQVNDDPSGALVLHSHPAQLELSSVAAWQGSNTICTQALRFSCPKRCYPG
jgi:hypothetical protein